MFKFRVGREREATQWSHLRVKDRLQEVLIQHNKNWEEREASHQIFLRFCRELQGEGDSRSDQQALNSETEEVSKVKLSDVLDKYSINPGNANLNRRTRLSQNFPRRGELRKPEADELTPFYSYPTGSLSELCRSQIVVFTWVAFIVSLNFKHTKPSENNSSVIIKRNKFRMLYPDLSFWGKGLENIQIKDYGDERQALHVGDGQSSCGMHDGGGVYYVLVNIYV